MKKCIILLLSIATFNNINAQALRIPGNTNIVCKAGRKVGVTDIEINYSSPGVKVEKEKYMEQVLCLMATKF